MIDVVEDNSRMKTKLVYNSVGLDYLPAFLAKAANPNQSSEGSGKLLSSSAPSSTNVTMTGMEINPVDSSDDTDDEAHPAKQSLRLANRSALSFIIYVSILTFLS